MRRACTVAAIALAVGGGLFLGPARPAGAADSEQELRDRIAFMTRSFEEEIEKSGARYVDPALDAYLQSVLDRLFPDHAGALRVRVLRDRNFNAFALANGHIYFYTGTLLRVDDEAELASILGHEGTHVTADHVYRFMRTLRTGNVVTDFVEIAGQSMGIPLVGAMLGYSTLSGFSREHERESDRGGLERMIAAGYDPRAGGQTFARLARELAARKIKQPPFFFSSHPRVLERVANFEAMTKDQPQQGDRRGDEYRARTRQVRLDTLAAIHLAGDNKLMLFLLDQERMVETLPPEAHYYLGEALRLRNAAGDQDRAVEEYRRALAAAPEFAPTYFALGSLYLRLARPADARPLFERFIALAPDAPQAAYARQYATQLAAEPVQ